MKLSLRNLALTGAIALATSVIAQETTPVTPTVTKKWFWSSDKLGSTGDFRFGTGWDGQVIMPNKTDKKIYYINENGVANTVDAASTGLGITMTHDDAGNLLYHPSFAATAGPDCTAWVIYNQKTGEFTKVEVTVPEEAKAQRMDCIGRVIGDMLSEEGALVVCCPQVDNTKPYLIKIAEGKQVELGFSDYPVAETAFASAFDSTTLGQFFATFDEVQDMGDDWANAIAIRKRGSGVPSYLQDGNWVTMPVPSSGKSLSDGYDVFTLNDQLYEVVPAVKNYSPRFAIVNVDTKETIYTSPESDELWISGQTFTSITANKVSDNKVEIYICGQTGGGNYTYAGLTVVEIPGQSEEPAPLYLTGDFTDPVWSADKPAEMTYDATTGVYTYETKAKGGFKISTTKGSWDEFNAGVLGVTDGDAATVLKLDEVTTLTAGKTANLVIANTGDYVIKVDLEKSTITLTGTEDEAPEIEAPAKVYVRGDLNGWAINDDHALTLQNDVKGQNGEFVYTGTFTKPAGEFKICDQEDWNACKINFGSQDPNNYTVNHTGTVGEAARYGAWWGCRNFKFADNLDNVAVEFHWNPDKDTAPSYLVLKKTTGVETIEAAGTPATYYNLNGVQVSGTLAPGLYIKHAAGKATKVLVK